MRSRFLFGIFGPFVVSLGMARAEIPKDNSPVVLSFQPIPESILGNAPSWIHNPDGTLTAFWDCEKPGPGDKEDHLCSSRWDGKGWVPTETLTTGKVAHWKRLDTSQGTWLVWVQSTPKAEGGENGNAPLGLFARLWNGKTWQPAEEIALVTEPLYRTLQVLANGPDGIQVAWVQNATQSTTTQEWRVATRTSTWGTPQVVPNQGTGQLLYLSTWTASDHSTGLAWLRQTTPQARTLQWYSLSSCTTAGCAPAAASATIEVGEEELEPLENVQIQKIQTRRGDLVLAWQWSTLDKDSQWHKKLLSVTLSQGAWSSVATLTEATADEHLSLVYTQHLQATEEVVILWQSSSTRRITTPTTPAFLHAAVYTPSGWTSPTLLTPEATLAQIDAHHLGIGIPEVHVVPDQRGGFWVAWEQAGQIRARRFHKSWQALQILNESHEPTRQSARSRRLPSAQGRSAYETNMSLLPNGNFLLAWGVKAESGEETEIWGREWNGKNWLPLTQLLKQNQEDAITGWWFVRPTPDTTMLLAKQRTTESPSARNREDFLSVRLWGAVGSQDMQRMASHVDIVPLGQALDVDFAKRPLYVWKPLRGKTLSYVTVLDGQGWHPYELSQIQPEYVFFSGDYNQTSTNPERLNQYPLQSTATESLVVVQRKSDGALGTIVLRANKSQ